MVICLSFAYIAPGVLDLQVSASARLTATVLPENVADKSVTWSSNLPNIALVNSTTGEVTALAVGKAEITATTNDKAGGMKKKTRRQIGRASCRERV